MWPIAVMLGICTAAVVIEVPGLIQRRWIKECVVFFLLLLLGVGLNVSWFLKIPIPNPLDWILVWLQPFGEAWNRWLE